MSQPVNLNLLSIRFPIPALASICHRISGVVLLFGIGYLTWLLGVALEDESGFNWVAQAAQGWFHGTLIWIVLVALVYHFLAGIRHLLMDFQVGENLRSSRISANFVFCATFVIALLIAFWLIAS